MFLCWMGYLTCSNSSFFDDKNPPLINVRLKPKIQHKNNIQKQHNKMVGGMMNRIK